ncbi:hypothetical protein [Idiomarina abyssalis]|uniref:hypothetical protein n=1 Tax=Idiomarina abyssalis TaxID=86102 RepID=UPI003A8F460F
MGSKSSSSSNQNTDNYSTSIGVEGDNSGYIATGNGNSFNITQTDHGLVDGLIDIWGDMSGNVAEMATISGDMAYDNARMTENVTSNAFDYGRDVNSDSLNFASDTVGDAFNFGNDALNVASDAQNSAFNFGNDALNFAQDSQRGVFDLVGDTLAGALGFGSDALTANSNLATDSINAQNALADAAIAENSDLAYAMMQSAENMHGNNTAFANNALLTTTGALESANQGMSDLAYYSIDNNSNLAASLAEGAVDKISEAYSNAGDQTILAHKQAMQFAEHASRSDGQQLAISTNKSMTYIVIGLGGVAILALFMGRK